MGDAPQSGHGWVTMEWADGVYSFRLSHGPVQELEEKLDMSIFEIGQRLQDETCKTTLIGETMRCALIGGGTKATDAYKLVKRYVYERPYAECRQIASMIVRACIFSPNPIDLTKIQDDTGEPPVATENAQTDLTTP